MEFADNAEYLEASQAIRSPERLAAVRATGLLDSEVEEAFDRLTRLAVRVMGVPASFVSLVDERRDFYKSACGFGEPLASARQLEGPTFCHFAIQSEEALVIPDTRADELYRNVPTVESLGVAAYVGVPIVVNGQAIGSFCVIDTKPHPWSESEIELLRELAAIVVSEISLRSARADADRIRAEFETANRAKGDFLAAMSHDLRTPLNAIGGHAQLIEMGVQGPVTEAQLLSAGRIMRAQQHLLTLINGILQFAKVDSGEVEIDVKPADLAKICTDLTALVESQARAKNIAFACDMRIDGVDGTTLTAVTDAERLLQILINLTTNAIKFTESGGSVSVTGINSGEYLEIQVRDTGRGIASDQLDKVFEPFVQIAKGKGRREGVGLGLASSRKLARLMSGDILVESTPGAGSVFKVILPAV